MSRRAWFGASASSRALARSRAGDARDRPSRESAHGIGARLRGLSALSTSPGLLVGVGLGLLLSLAPLAIGSVHGWARALLQTWVYVLSVAWLVERTYRGLDNRSPRAFAWAGATLCLYLAFQVAPLSPEWLTKLSPAAADLRRHTIDVLAADDSPDSATSPSESQGGSVPAAVRQQIAERAAEAQRQNATPPTLSIDRVAAEADLRLYLALGLALWVAATLPRPALVFRALVFSGVTVSGLAIVQNVAWNGKILWFFLPYDGGSYYPRMTGPFVNADHFALFLELTLLPAAALMFYWLRRPSSRRHRRGSLPKVLVIAVLAISVAVMVAGLIGSASRGGIVGALLGAAFLWSGIRRQPDAAAEAQPVVRARDRAAKRKRRGSRLDRLNRVVRRVAPAGMAIAVVGGGLFYAGSGARGLLDLRLGRTILAPDLKFRIEHWQQTLPILADYPFFGVGLHGWRQVFGLYERVPIVGYRVNYAHNDYLEWACEVGLVGVLLTLVLAITYVRWARSSPSAPSELRFGICASLVAVAWHELFDFGLRIPANALLLAVLLGLLCNPYWNGTPDAVDERNGARRRVGFARLLACLVAAMIGARLCLANVRQFREFTEWSRVRNGSLDLSLTPRDPETWYELGKRLTAPGLEKMPLGGACFRTAIAERPSSAWAYWRLASTEADPARKLRILDAAIFLQPTQVEWRLAKAALLNSAGDSKAALAEVEEGAHRAPMLAQHPYLRKDNAHLSGSILDAVDRGFRRALEEQPGNADLLNEVAWFYHLFGSSREAAELWVRAAKVTGDWAKDGRLAAENYAEAEDYAKAEELSRRAIGRDPAEAEGYRVLAMSVFRAQGNYAEARKTLELGAHHSRRPADLYLALYTLEHEQGNTPEALDALAKAADLRRRDAWTQFYLGFAYVQAGDNHRSVIALDRAISIDGRRPEFYFYKGVALERRFDLAGALANYQAAAKLATKNPGYSASADRVAALLRHGAQSPPVSD